jgi:hypothetical protein
MIGTAAESTTAENTAAENRRLSTEIAESSEKER